MPSNQDPKVVHTGGGIVNTGSATASSVTFTVGGTVPSEIWAKTVRAEEGAFDAAQIAELHATQAAVEVLEAGSAQVEGALAVGDSITARSLAVLESVTGESAEFSSSATTRDAYVQNIRPKPGQPTVYMEFGHTAMDTLGFTYAEGIGGTFSESVSTPTLSVNNLQPKDGDTVTLMDATLAATHLAVTGTADIETLDANTATAGLLTATSAEIGNLVATNATVGSLTATSLSVPSLNMPSLTATETLTSEGDFRSINVVVKEENRTRPFSPGSDLFVKDPSGSFTVFAENPVAENERPFYGKNSANLHAGILYAKNYLATPQVRPISDIYLQVRASDGSDTAKLQTREIEAYETETENLTVNASLTANAITCASVAASGAVSALSVSSFTCQAATVTATTGLSAPTGQFTTLESNFLRMGSTGVLETPNLRALEGDTINVLADTNLPGVLSGLGFVGDYVSANTVNPRTGNSVTLGGQITVVGNNSATAEIGTKSTDRLLRVRSFIGGSPLATLQVEQVLSKCTPIAAGRFEFTHTSMTRAAGHGFGETSTVILADDTYALAMGSTAATAADMLSVSSLSATATVLKGTTLSLLGVVPVLGFTQDVTGPVNLTVEIREYYIDSGSIKTRKLALTSGQEVHVAIAVFYHTGVGY